MNKRTKADYRGIVLLSLFILGALVALTIVPRQFKSEASRNKSGFRTESHEPGYDNYDIRLDKTAADFRSAARQSVGRSEELVSSVREGFVKGEDQLRQRIPTLKVEYNPEGDTPEVIAPDINQGFKTMTAPSAGRMKNAEVLRDFVKQNDRLIGVNSVQADQLKVTADYTNPDGNLSYAHLEQFINDVPVFRAEIKAGFTKQGAMFRVINNLAPGLSYDSLSLDFGDPTPAVRAAFTKVTRPITADDVARNDKASNDLKVVFGDGDWATTAEKMYFPTEPGVAVPAWRVLIWQPVQAYYVVVDAQTGTMLWRKNLGNDQLQSATYEIYAAPTSWIGIAGNPAPMSPGPTDPTVNPQGTLGTRSNSTLIGNEAPYTFNDLGWITDGANITDGNNVEAGLDRTGPNGVDATQTGSPNRVFTSTWNPPPGSPGPGDDPLTAQAQRGAVIQMFYVMNRYHDELYRLGFTEAARNFQANNFGRGGVQGDRVSAEGQDIAGFNNANFNAGSDGTRGRMQMFLWNAMSPDRDGTGDAEIIIHEVTHGTSQRLHNNNAGLTTNMSGGMGEGWGDFYGHTMLARPTEPLDSVNATGGYSLLNGFSSVGTGNYYYGIRRFPKARMSFTGGPNNRPHNPLTFADIDSTQVNTSDGAFPAMNGPHTPPSNPFDQVHAAGEVWSSALWEVRCRMVGRLGFSAGTSRILQIVTDGMKLDPNGPTFLQARDSLLAAAAALPAAPEAAADVADVREGFRIRGMGFGASIQNAGSSITGNQTRVTESFFFLNALVINPVTFSDAGGNNNGFADPGETIVLSVPANNTTGSTVNNVSVSANGGPAVGYGNIANAATVTKDISFTVPANTPCGSIITVALNLTSDLGVQMPFNKSISIGQPIIGFTENFDGVTAPALPAGWTTAVTGSGAAAVTSTTTPSSAPNDAFFTDPTTIATSELISPAILINSPGAQLSFKNLFNMESTFDGMVLEISNPAVNGGAYQDILAAGGSFVSGGYRATIAGSGTCPASLDGRQAWTGLSAGSSGAPAYIDTVVNLPASANGQSIRLKFKSGTDCSVAATGVAGVRIDSLSISTGSSCQAVAANSDARADFDGDNRTDISVFRPSDGNWYLNRSTGGFAVVNWGLATDTPAPSDYDGDDKTDVAVFRPSDTLGVPDYLVLNSATNTLSGMEFGSTGDIPVAGDVNGDDTDDYIVYRPSTGAWYTMVGPSTVTITGTGTGLTPLSGDFDGDAKTDVALYNPSSSTFAVTQSGGGSILMLWGLPGDKPVIGDYDGDGKDDIAVFRPSDGIWYVHGSLGTDIFTQWGVAGDVPSPGDYDGDGKDDRAVFRTGTWYILNSNSGVQITGFGLATDKSIPNAYQPQ